MGAENSKIVSGGSLEGAYPPPVANVPEANLPSNATKTFKATVSKAKKRPTTGAETMQVMVKGKQMTIRIPAGLRAGDTFNFPVTAPETDKVYASTLPALPGMEVVAAKPIIYATVSVSFWASSMNQQSMGGKIASMMQEAQTKMLQTAIDERCNAVLGMTFNVTNDSSGEHGNNKMVIVSAYGTPCVVVPSAAEAVVSAEAFVQPMFMGSR